MKPKGQDLVMFIVTILLCSTPVMFVSFEFMLPNLSTPDMGKNLLVILMISVAAGIPAGYFNQRIKLSIVALMLYTALGYALAFVLYSVPFAVYHANLALPPDIYYAQFLRFTVILLFLYVFGGIIGIVVGQLARDAVGREETKVLWGEERET